VAGVQFDRAGALWLGGVELLRTTTPEPDAPGISWAVDRDLTEYSALFYAPSNATLQIPNTVNDQYTGVIYISAKLVFFPASEATDDPAADNPKAVWADAVIPLAPPPASSNPWGSMAIAGTTPRTVPLQFPRVDVTEAQLDLYASGHGGSTEVDWLMQSLLHLQSCAAPWLYPHATALLRSISLLFLLFARM
jgi:hypothetical protein